MLNFIKLLLGSLICFGAREESNGIHFVSSTKSTAPKIIPKVEEAIDCKVKEYFTKYYTKHPNSKYDILNDPILAM